MQSWQRNAWLLFLSPHLIITDIVTVQPTKHQKTVDLPPGFKTISFYRGRHFQKGKSSIRFTKCSFKDLYVQVLKFCFSSTNAK